MIKRVYYNLCNKVNEIIKYFKIKDIPEFILMMVGFIYLLDYVVEGLWIPNLP
jgi:hypothetical protein